MSIRSAAAAAIDAEKTATEATRKQNWADHALAGEQIVTELTGLHGKAVRARNDRPESLPLGHGTVVAVTDEDGVIHLKVDSRPLPSKSNWGQRLSEREFFLVLTNESGGYIHHPEEPSRFYSGSSRIRSLAGLGRALGEYDDWIAEESAAVAERRRLES